jgi:hypothetical protein
MYRHARGFIKAARLLACRQSPLNARRLGLRAASGLTGFAHGHEAAHGQALRNVAVYGERGSTVIRLDWEMPHKGEVKDGLEVAGPPGT